jgi:hypothetical protein|tara:strand:+ start:444 stop:641 length:198 start_codon:yes stop_codon:yes gene_type:complete
MNNARSIHNELISFRVPNQIKERLEHYAEREWVGVSDIVRNGVRQQLELLSEKHDNPKQPKAWSV